MKLATILADKVLKKNRLVYNKRMHQIYNTQKELRVKSNKFITYLIIKRFNNFYKYQPNLIAIVQENLVLICKNLIL